MKNYKNKTATAETEKLACRFLRVASPPRVLPILDALQIRNCACVCVRPCLFVCLCRSCVQFLSPMNKSALSVFTQMISKCILPLPDSSLIIKGRFDSADRCAALPTARRLGRLPSMFSSNQKWGILCVIITAYGYGIICLRVYEFCEVGKKNLPESVQETNLVIRVTVLSVYAHP